MNFLGFADKNYMEKSNTKTEMITYKFRLRPSKSQARQLNRWMGTCRFVYNSALEERTAAYEKTGKSLSYIDQQNELPECKKTKGLEWLKEVPSQSLQMALRHLDRAYTNFFEKRASFPKKKKKGRCTDAVAFPQGEKLSVVYSGKKAHLIGVPRMKTPLKIVKHREIVGPIRNYTITKKSGAWYVAITCEKEAIDYKLFDGKLDASKAVGIDLGITKTICTNTGKTYNINLEVIKKIELQIALLQRRLALQSLYSDKWRKLKSIIAKKHSKIARIRHDFLHKVSHDVCKNHAIVVLEDLRVKNMSKSASGTIEEPGKLVAQKSGLNRSILRQGWGIFRTYCDYKTKRFGGTMQLVPPMNTSRRCSYCDHIEASNRKSQSEFVCKKCGHTENADVNASKNIKALGLQSLELTSLEAPTIAA